MEIRVIQVDGVSITLTKTQINQIKKVKAERRKSLKTFEDVLKRFGFIRHRDTRKPDDHCYANDGKGWWAEVYDDGYLWMTGAELKSSSSFPGGWTYHTVEELTQELEKH